MENEFETLARRVEAQEPDANERLFALLYHELHRIADHHVQRSAPAMTLGSTTLLHETYLSMKEREGLVFPDRSRFFAYASRAMRSFVIDYARRRRAQKRGRELEITLVGDEPAPVAAQRFADEMETLGDALDELESIDPKLAALVDQHFFCGLSFTEIAALRGVSEKTVQRDWRKARLLLQRSVLDDEAGGGSPTQDANA